MKLLRFIFLVVIMLPFSILSETVTDVYNFRMCVKIPRIYNNTQSLGYRKYQSQTIRGYLYLSYDSEKPDQAPTIWFSDLTNYTHKINNKCIIYKCTVDEGIHVYPRVVYIGNNKTDVFTTPSIMFYLDAEPSYNIGEDTEDNSLLVTVSGYGSSARKKQVEYVDGKKTTFYYRHITSLHGYLAGTLGCGCKSYGHTSPTRVAGLYGPTDTVDDVASVSGTWSANFKCSRIEK